MIKMESQAGIPAEKADGAGERMEEMDKRERGERGRILERF